MRRKYGDFQEIFSILGDVLEKREYFKDFFEKNFSKEISHQKKKKRWLQDKI
jgi:hypothetical protein